MKNFSLLLLGLMLSVSLNAQLIKSEAEDAFWYPDDLGQDEHVEYNDIVPSSGGWYVMTGYASSMFNFYIATAGTYNIAVWACSGDEKKEREANFAIDREHTCVPGVDACSNRYSVIVDYPYFGIPEGDRKFVRYIVKTGHYFTAGEHYIVYDSWDPGTWGYIRIDFLEICRGGDCLCNGKDCSSIDKIAAGAEIVTTGGVAKVISNEASAYSLAVYNATGSQVYAKNNILGNTEVKDLQQGIYLFQVKGLSGITTKKVVIQ